MEYQHFRDKKKKYHSANSNIVFKFRLFFRTGRDVENVISLCNIFKLASLNKGR